MSDQHQAGGSEAGSTDWDFGKVVLNPQGALVEIQNRTRLTHQLSAECVERLRDQNQLRADLEAARIERDYLAHEHQSHHPVCSATPAICSHENELAQARARISELEQSHAECARTAALERAVVEAARAYRNASQSLQAHQTVCLDSPCEDCDDILGPAVERAEDVLFTALDAATATKAADA